MQFEFAGPLPLADGRYLARGPAPEEQESVLVLLRLGAPQASGSRRRRRAREVEAGSEPRPLTLTRATAIRAFAPFEDPGAAARWLDEACEAEDTIEVLAAEGLALLNRALHAQAVSAANPNSKVELDTEDAERVLIGFGSGEEVADSLFTEAREVDIRPRASKRRRREEELRPQERVAAVLRGREQLDTCETLLLRARADFAAGRDREAALQLRVGLEALLVELKGALADPDHEEDMATLSARKTEAGNAANTALQGDLDDQQRAQVEELLKLSERVLRRRRILRG
ncbi:MAG TPA: hypothetical protein VLI94_13175 [Solirubrobacterales bacterium]|nr:hypothetical protein [Solirubrobacterales bacterium]